MKFALPFEISFVFNYLESVTYFIWMSNAYQYLLVNHCPSFLGGGAFSTKNGVDPMGRSVEKPRTVEDVMDRSKPWQLSEVVDSVQCRLVNMPDSTDTSSKVC